MPSLETRIAELERAIAAQEAQRALLGDEVVEVTIRALRGQIAALRGASLEAAASPGPPAPRLRSGEIPRELAEKMQAVGNIEGERRQITVLSADISGYTELSEALDPGEVAALIHEVLGGFTRAVHQQEGYVDKYIGDAVMAVFGAPLAHEDDAERESVTKALKAMSRDGLLREDGDDFLVSPRICEGSDRY